MWLLLAFIAIPMIEIALFIQRWRRNWAVADVGESCFLRRFSGHILCVQQGHDAAISQTCGANPAISCNDPTEALWCMAR